MLGRDLFTGLSLQLRGGQVSTDQCTCTASSIDAKSENRLGCGRGFMHPFMHPSVWCSACAVETEAVTFLNSQRGVHGFAEAC